MTLTLSAVLSKISHMPEPPKAAVQAINLLEDPAVPVAKAAEFISMDETLTAKLLRLSNSAYYGFQGRIATVNEAIVRLGVNVVKCSLYASMMESSGLKISPFFLELWRSSLYTGMMAKDMAVMLNHPRKDVCFTAGLLCDLGQILMNEAAEKVYPELVTAVRQNQADMAAIESELYGFNHTHVGAKLAEVWQLPPIYENVIRFHHNVDDIKNRILPEDYKLMMIVATANSLSPLFCEDWNTLELPFKTLKQLGLAAPSEAEFLAQLTMHRERYERDVTQISNAMFGTALAAR